MAIRTDDPRTNPGGRPAEEPGRDPGGRHPVPRPVTRRPIRLPWWLVLAPRPGSESPAEAARVRPSMAGKPDPARPQRRLGPAGRVLVMGVVCFLVWALMAAPALKRSAQASPLGARRTAALAVLGPLARISSLLSLDRAGILADGVLHRHRFTDAPRSAPEPIRPGTWFPSTPGSTGLPPSAGPGGRPTPSGSPSAGPSASPNPLAGTLPRPTAAHPIRVLSVGDSLGGDLAIGLGRAIGDRRSYDLSTDWREATGLARPDYFDWAAQLARDIDRYDPQIVVAMFGANDAQGTLVGDQGYQFNTAQWRAIYRQRVARIMDMVTRSGRILIWVGMPPMASSSLTAHMKVINGLVRGQAVRHPGVVYTDSWPAFSDRHGRYSAFLPDASGAQQDVRTTDGVHLTAAGDDRLAQVVLAELRAMFRPPRAEPVPARPAHAIGELPS